ncbi:TonB-dependent receptor [cf. Phormidesmis sp. LEGE 11477]|uniref:TonB-dependent receptor n=1 Tax=cf. Phormidesmis sp. LEGE 11477 TaxID=1828680 RepID=UPI00187FD214|nr:TonB-dependent receptor [cf. Phormidesmis sp. LEGE 11477]MBE9064390.1 TonB-dependent receptor [cf. Phormidesmis sp. LEGE 11477]
MTSTVGKQTTLARRFSYLRLAAIAALSLNSVFASLVLSSAAMAQEIADPIDREDRPDTEQDSDDEVETENDSDNPNVIIRTRAVASNVSFRAVQQLALVTETVTATEEAEETEAERLLLARAGLRPAANSAKKTPWLARSPNPSEPDDIAENAISLNLAAIEDAPAEKPGTPWLARTSEAQREQGREREREQPANRLARSRATEDANERANEPADARLATAPRRRETRKRPANWVSIFHEELSPSNAESGVDSPTELAADPAINSVADPAVNPDAIAARSSASGGAIYDIGDLPQTSITPTYLAGSVEESEIAVNASDVAFLSPEPNAFLNTPATSVVLRFPVGAKIALLVNSRVVDPNLIGRTETDTETGQRTQTWYGVTLSAGDNQLEIVSTDTGEVLKSLLVTVRGMPAELTLLSPRAIPADGRSTSTIRGQLVDESGNISRWESTVTLQASDGEFLGADANPDAPGFQVRASKGEFVAELQSSLESGLVQIRARAADFEAFSQIQFVTPQRSNLISGVVDVRFGAQGTDYYGSYRDFLPLDGDNSYGLDVDAAVFATGNLGEWLYTGAYNSDRTLNQDCNGDSRLFRANGGNCESTYTTYGDDSYSDVITPSLDSVFLRLERTSPTANAATDYVMWGDYNTEEFSTSAQLFTATSRRLHGFKANYNFGNLALTGLYANNVEGFQRDTIAPDGTSGFYFTSQRNLLPGSERVYLELEELERPGTVLERTALTRGADYEIDYDRGTLLFNDPVARTQVDEFGLLLVRRIVTTYQHENGEDTDLLAGRLQYNFNQQQGQESWVGTSYLNEDRGTRDFSLYGVDAQVAIGDNTQITAEIARSTSEFETSDRVSGNAYRLEVDSALGDKLNGRAYIRSTDAGFSNEATSSFVPGQTRYGAQLAGRITRNTTLRARFDREDNTGNAPRVITDLTELLNNTERQPGRALDNSLTTYSLGVSQRFGRSTADVDWLHRDRTDRLDGDRSVSSAQLRTRLMTPLTDRLSIIAQNELTLSSSEDPIYPSRTLIGLNWEVMDGLNVGVNQLFYGGDRGSATTVDVTGEHTFASDTTIHGRFSTVNGRQLGGTIGLEQGINLAPGLDLDLGFEKTFSTLGNETAASTQFSQPFAPGQSASAIGLAGGESYSVGLSYTDNPDFQANTRFEHRASRGNSNTVFTLSALGRITPELTLLGDYRTAHTANQRITGLGRTSLLKLGMAYRNPRNDRFNALLRYEHRLNPNSIPTNANLGASSETQEHLFSTEAIYAPNWRWELFGKYALRHSRTEFNGAGNSFSNGSTVQLAQARATYRLGYRWDTVGELRWLAGSGYSETGFSVEAGYYPLPDLRISAGYSGGANDTDFGENRSNGGFYFGASAKLSGLLDGFATQPNDPPQQQESVVEAAEADLSQENISEDTIPEDEELEENLRPVLPDTEEEEL